ncbi:MAG: methyltransferase family protein [Rhodospirillales bacterium]
MTVPGETPAEGMRILPPMVFLGALVAMGVLHQFSPGPEIIPKPWNRLDWVPFGLGFPVAFWVKFRFDRADTPIHAFKQTTALVTDGLFRYSRNPVYVAMVAALAGIAVVLGTLAPVIVVPVFAWVIQRRFVEAEERMLEDAFGDDYRAYKQRVRRWL